VVREVLDAVPLIHSAEQAGELKVEVKLGDGEITPGSRKRTIVEQVR
jgi:hypothetical protein